MPEMALAPPPVPEALAPLPGPGVTQPEMPPPEGETGESTPDASPPAPEVVEEVAPLGERASSGTCRVAARPEKGESKGEEE